MKKAEFGSWYPPRDRKARVTPTITIPITTVILMNTVITITPMTTIITITTAILMSTDITIMGRRESLWRPIKG